MLLTKHCIVLVVLVAVSAGPALAQATEPEANTSPGGATSSASTPPSPTAPPSEDQLPSWKTEARRVVGDFRHVFTPEAAVILAVGGLGGLAVHPKDPEVTRWAADSRNLENVFSAGQRLGDIAVQSGAALATYISGRLSKRPVLTQVGAELLRAHFVAGSFTMALKLSVDRTRPDGYRYSMPSGHASGAFATAAVLQRHFGWKAGLPAYLAGTYIGASRLTENRHYLSDVAVGAALGVIAGRAVTFGHGRATFAVTPIAANGGTGVGLTLTSPRAAEAPVAR